jgi:general transcription factor 3C polypeptide 3 (transcription factor C subunit 4)
MEQFHDDVVKLSSSDNPNNDIDNADIGTKEPKRRGQKKGTHRGPRHAAEPTGDIKLRLGQANNAFIKQHFDEALRIVADIIRINAETYEAWTLLALIFQEMGNLRAALRSLQFGTGLRHKFTKKWHDCASFALNDAKLPRKEALKEAQWAYALCIHNNPGDLFARLKKAEICAERGNYRIAVSEFEKYLKLAPHDLEALRGMAVASIDLGDVQTAIDHYRESIAYYKTSPIREGSVFGWNDVDIYITILEFAGAYEVAIKETKSLARWLLGRADEAFWEEVTDNDCEWDIGNSRRIEIPAFTVGKQPLSSYGENLPLELRVKLALCRLNLGQQTEALVSPLQKTV